MRKDEGDEVEAAFCKWDIHFIRVNAEDRFLTKLAGVTEPEAKRKIIGEEFIRVFEAEAKKIGTVDYPGPGHDLPRRDSNPASASPAVIKSHHNVGGLPDYVDFKEIIEPLRMLFKDEVRQSRPRAGICRNIWSCASPSPAPVLPSASSAISRRKSSTRCARPTSSSATRSPRAGLDRQTEPVFRGPTLHALRRRHG